MGYGGRGRGMGSPDGGSYGGYGGGPRNRRLEKQEGKLFLGGLDNQTTKENLVEYCEQWGAVSDSVVMENRGFGFVTFESPSCAQKFLEHRDHFIMGKGVEAKAAVPKNAGGSSNLTKKMFVGGTGEISDQDFKLYFDPYGEIDDAVIVRTKDGSSRGFGFVTFKDEISVEKCLVQMHTLPNGKSVDLKRAVPREQMGGSGGGFSNGASGGFSNGGPGGYGPRRGGGRVGGGMEGGYGGGMGGYGGSMGGMGPYAGYGGGAMSGYGGYGGGYGGGPMGGGYGGGGYGGGAPLYGRASSGRGGFNRYKPY
ncbi:unnamed protein product [Ostreobium quekettii]|uniref:RRM domain-containing protein n=1 Tax=Ostreobium quekettii TaxID=121088 RepID=A0A8S1J7N0_9CHLO|nr:unnamed protein product [Ostreobium quekettii]